MSIDQKTVINQIDAALGRWRQALARSKYDDCSDLSYTEIAEIVVTLAATIDRLAPPGSQYRERAHAAIERYGENPYNMKILPGILNALRADYEAGYLQAIHELIHADVFADFLEMADYILDEGYKDPAAVLAGGVLEEHLRKLCQKNNIQIVIGSRHKKADSLNAELAGANAYSTLDQKSVTAWLDLRNKAAHGRYNEYTKEQVVLMIQGIRHFLSRYIA
jgi:hypothetical protein